MPDPLDDQLAALGQGPVRLAPAEAVRRRGEQRRARARALAAGSGLAVVALLAGVALAAGGGGAGERDSLQPEPFASDAPDAEPGRVSALVLDASTLSRVRGGTWTVQSEEPSTSPFITACAEATGGFEAVSGAVRTLEGPGTVVRSQVLAYPDAVRATGAWKDVWLEIERCPEQQDAVDGPLRVHRTTLVRSLPDAGQHRAYGSWSSRQCPDCAEETEHFSFSFVGSRLVLVRLAGGELTSLPALTDAAEERARCEGECTRPTEEPPPPRTTSWAVGDAFLSPERASQVESEGWRVPARQTPDPAPLADLCGTGTVPGADRLREQAERAMSSTREAGGSSLAQEVYRYDSAETAKAAFAESLAGISRCEEVQDPNDEPGNTIRSEHVHAERRGTYEAVLLRRVPCKSGSCVDHWATYLMLVHAAEALTVVGYTIAEDGDPRAEAEALLTAVAEHLAQTVGG